MTLKEFRLLTDALDPKTEIHIVGPGGVCRSATVISADDLVQGDPAYDSIHPLAITLDIEGD